MIIDAGHSRSEQPKSKVVHGTVSALVYMENEAPLQQVINLIGCKRQCSLRILENVIVIFLILGAMQIINNSIFSCY